jgi:D-alanyl-D-alanine carboxypeptidase
MKTPKSPIQKALFGSILIIVLIISISILSTSDNKIEIEVPKEEENLESLVDVLPEVDEEESEEVEEQPTPEPTLEPTPSVTPTKPAEPVVPQPTNWWDYPSIIVQTPKNGNDLLVIVNKKYQLPSTYTPADLVTLQSVNIRLKGQFQVRSIILQDLSELGSAAKADGLDLSIVSAYRSYSQQQSTYQYWVNYNGGDASKADTVSARPGHSQHQLGTTVDFSSSEVGDQIGAVFNTTRAATWLNNNAWKYGFALAYPAGQEVKTGYSPEAWHYRYIGVNNAKSWKASGLTLDEWLLNQ